MGFDNILKILYDISLIFAIVVCTTVLSIAVISFTYNKFLKNEFYIRKKKRVIKKLSAISLMDDEKKVKYEKRIESYSKFIEDDSKTLIDGLTITDIEISEKVKRMIDEMISVEIYSALRQYLPINAKYPIINLDTDIKAISSKVFNGLNPKLMHTNMIFSEEYIMEYIVGQTFNTILQVVINHNSSLL